MFLKKKMKKKKKRKKEKNPPLSLALFCFHQSSKLLLPLAHKLSDSSPSLMVEAQQLGLFSFPN